MMTMMLILHQSGQRAIYKSISIYQYIVYKVDDDDEVNFNYGNLGKGQYINQYQYINTSCIKLLMTMMLILRQSRQRAIYKSPVRCAHYISNRLQLNAKEIIFYKIHSQLHFSCHRFWVE